MNITSKNGTQRHLGGLRTLSLAMSVTSQPHPQRTGSGLPSLPSLCTAPDGHMPRGSRLLDSYQEPQLRTVQNMRKGQGLGDREGQGQGQAVLSGSHLAEATEFGVFC